MPGSSMRTGTGTVEAPGGSSTSMADSTFPSARTRISAGPPAAENTSASTPVISPARTVGGNRIAFTKPPPSLRTPDGGREDPHARLLEERQGRGRIAFRLPAVAEQHHPLQPVRWEPRRGVAKRRLDVRPALVQRVRRGEPRGRPAVEDLDLQQGVGVRYGHRAIGEGHEVRVIAAERPARFPGPGDRILHGPRGHAPGYIHHERHGYLPRSGPDHRSAEREQQERGGEQPQHQRGAQPQLRPAEVRPERHQHHDAEERQQEKRPESFESHESRRREPGILTACGEGPGEGAGRPAWQETARFG